MKKAMTLSLVLLTTTIFAQDNINSSEYPVGGWILGDISKLDESLNCVDNLDWQMNASSQQNFLMQSYMRNLQNYGASKLINHTPALKDLTLELKKKYDIDVAFISGGFSNKTNLQISSHDKAKEINLLLQSDKYKNVFQETFSVSRLVTRNTQQPGMGIGGYPGGGYGSPFISSGMGFAFNEFSNSGNGTYANNQAYIPSLEISYKVDKNGKDEINLSYIQPEWAGLQASVEGRVTDESAASDQFLMVMKRNFQIKFNMGFGENYYKIYDDSKGQLLKETNNPFEVCSFISEKEISVASIDASEELKILNSEDYQKTSQENQVIRE